MWVKSSSNGGPSLITRFLLCVILGRTSFPIGNIFRGSSGLSSAMHRNIKNSSGNTANEVSFCYRTAGQAFLLILWKRLFLVCRREECANRPRSEFVPKTLADLNIDAVLHGSAEAGINGGRFIHPSSNTHLSRINSNQSNRNVYSSQQNLSKTNANYHSNFSRNRIYGSQQSLSNNSSSTSNNNYNALNSQLSNNNYNSNSNYSNNHQYNSNNGNSTANSPTDAWLNAWNTPDLPAATPTVTIHHRQNQQTSQQHQPQHHHHNHHRHQQQQQPQPPQPHQSSASASSHFNNYNNSKNAHYNDPWTGELSFLLFFHSNF